MEFLWNSLWHTLLNILVAINSVVGVPGISIIVFTIFIRLLTVPLTMKSLRSSRNMQAIQPKIKEIQKQYSKDRQKQQEETMKLYREYGINPAAGCFPILVQLPIFFGLFSALQFTLQGNTGNATQDAAHMDQLRQILWNGSDAWMNAANFTGSFGWVPNLAQADPFWIWPVLSGVFQFVQSRMSMPYREPGTPQDPQQKMMNTMLQFMPIYIVFISIGFPAGTVIYWAFSSLFGAVQQYFITGFGMMPTLPGLGFLPIKLITPPPPPTEPVALGKKGLMQKMMDRALDAQQAQKASQDASLTGGSTIAPPDTDGASTVRVTNARKENYRSQNKGKETPRYASQSVTSNGGVDGTQNGAATAVPLPRKKRSKR